MDGQALVLGHVLRGFPKFTFSMETFDDRLRLQKFIYLLQAHDVYLGYDFSWYIRGPYCTSLTTAGFMLDGFYKMIPDGRDRSEGFANNAVRNRFKKFVGLVKGKETDANFLEAAASLHFLLETGMAGSRDDAVDKVFAKMKRGYEYSKTPQSSRVDREYVEGVLRKIESAGLVGGASDTRPAGRLEPVRLCLAESGPSEPVMPADMPRGMNARYVDKAFYYTLHDAARAGESDVELIGKNVFRPDEERPATDDYVMDDDVVLSIRSKRGIGIPAGMGT